MQYVWYLNPKNSDKRTFQNFRVDDKYTGYCGILELHIISFIHTSALFYLMD